jgi:hypothetical protein
MPSFNEQKLKDCVKHYGIDPNSVRFTPTRPGQNGIFIGYTPADKERNLEGGIVNDVTSLYFEADRQHGSPQLRSRIRGDHISVWKYSGRQEAC